MNSDKLEQIRQDAMYDAYFSSEFDRVKEWFLSNYEDPAENTPYDSSEGGYFYFCGGPYEAADEIYFKFSGEVEEAILDAVVEDVENISLEWAKVPSIEDFDHYTGIPSHIERFDASILNIQDELERVEKLPSQAFVCGLLFAHAISTMEAYLQNTFVGFIQENEEYKRRFLETDPFFKSEKIALSELYTKFESIDTILAEKILSTVFHRLPVVEKMFRNTLRIIFPERKADIYRAISKRHDIIHRNCRDKNGNDFKVTIDEVTCIAEFISDFVHNIQKQVEQIRSNKAE